MNSIKDKIYGNYSCLRMVDEIVYTRSDVYSYVASKLFDCDIRDCREFSDTGVKCETGKHRRDVAKKLCLGNMLWKDVAEKFGEPNLGEMIIKAFPFTFFDEIDEEPDETMTESEIFENKVIAAHSFLTEIRGYVRVKSMQRDFLNYCGGVLSGRWDDFGY